MLKRQGAGILHLRMSSILTWGWNRNPPLKGPRALSCCTLYAWKAPVSPLSIAMTSSACISLAGVRSNFCSLKGRSNSAIACISTSRKLWAFAVAKGTSVLSTLNIYFRRCLHIHQQEFRTPVVAARFLVDTEVSMVPQPFSASTLAFQARLSGLLQTPLSSRALIFTRPCNFSSPSSASIFTDQHL